MVGCGVDELADSFLFFVPVGCCSPGPEDLGAMATKICIKTVVENMAEEFLDHLDHP